MSQLTMFDAPAVIPPASKMSQQFKVLVSTETEEWYTPPDVIGLARLVLGEIDLDAASCAAAQKWIQARRFYTKEDDGLRRVWSGRVWLNPPYGKTNGKSNQAVWSSKLIAEYQAGRVSEAVLLVNAKLGYDWFNDLLNHWPICLAYERIKFINSETLRAGRGVSKQASAFVYLGPNYARFEKIFSQVGRVLPA